jgi:hypothetical protein
MGKKIRLTESELVSLLEKIVKEAKREEKINAINENRKIKLRKQRKTK